MANAIVSLAHSGSTKSIKHNQRLASEQNYLRANSNKSLKNKKERNQYLKVVEHPTPTPSCVTAKPIALRDKMLSNVTIDCFLR